MTNFFPDTLQEVGRAGALESNVTGDDWRLRTGPTFRGGAFAVMLGLAASEAHLASARCSPHTCLPPVPARSSSPAATSSSWWLTPPWLPGRQHMRCSQVRRSRFLQLLLMLDASMASWASIYTLLACGFFIHVGSVLFLLSTKSHWTPFTMWVQVDALQKRAANCY